MRFSVLTILAALAAEVIALPSSTHAVHEKRGKIPSQWMKRGKVHSTTILPMRIGLKQRNLHKGHDYLMDVSDPSSPSYAKHWTPEEVIAAFAPADETVDAVRDWLIKAGIHKTRVTHSDNKAWLAFDATTEEAEGLLHTEYHSYQHKSQGHSVTACEKYHVPKHIQKHIDYITPGVKLMAPVKRNGGTPLTLKKRVFGSETGINPVSPKLRRPAGMLESLDGLSTCDRAITPACVAALYNITPAVSVNPGNSLGIFEEGDFYAQKDLDLFFANFTPQIPQGTSPIPAFIDGAEAPVAVADAGGESELDFELAYPIVYPQAITLYQTDDINVATGNATTNGGFNTFLDALDGSYCTYSAFGETGNDPVLDPTYPDPLPGGFKGQLQCGVYTPTLVISVSYGAQEAALPAYYQERQCNEFMKLGLQGHSIFFASGDSGVAGRPGDPSPNGCLGPNSTIFNPTWPNSCPYLTNVGATKVYPGKTVFDPESAANDLAGQPYRSAYSSGGGFSNIYPIPSYQQAAVATYFADYDPGYAYYSGNDSFGANGGIYNRAGRGIPDVASNGDNIAVFVGGRFGLEGGTSASCPIFASVVTRINDARLDQNKTPIGFINPALYANPFVLNDITNGSNPGCGTNGFSAVPGWDPVTGLGTPNLGKMLDLFLGFQ